MHLDTHTHTPAKENKKRSLSRPSWQVVLLLLSTLVFRFATAVHVQLARKGREQGQYQDRNT